MRFSEITDEQWRFIEPLLPPLAKEGRPRVDDRMTINAILYVLTTGCRWMDLPREYGDDSTANLRLRRWEEKGVWGRITEALVQSGNSLGRLSMKRLSIDSTDVAAKKGGSSSATMVIRRSRGARYMHV
jgi:transposase